MHSCAQFESKNHDNPLGRTTDVLDSYVNFFINFNDWLILLLSTSKHKKFRKYFLQIIAVIPNPEKGSSISSYLLENIRISLIKISIEILS